MADSQATALTFFFTDIEGSTKRWENYPVEMQAALARHDEILRQTIALGGGTVFKTIGDAFCAVFTDPTAALSVALGAQRALLHQDWGPVGPLRVRMAINTGFAEPRDDDYFGPALNRVARLLAAGHGGQILVSRSTVDSLAGRLPAGAALRDLGERRLRDLVRPEYVYQLVAPDLAADFPPLRTLDARPVNLPAQATPLVGRDREAAALRDLLRRPGVRLVTLIGPGGIGKTRLSLRVAADLIDDYEDGVFFVPLATIRDPERIVPAIARALGIREDPGRPIREVLIDDLRQKSRLIVIDNFEQLVGAADVIGELLEAGPGIKVLVSSRILLRIYGEHEYRVPPLGLPDRRRRLSPETIGQSTAVALFLDRARVVRPDFALTPENGPLIAEICRRLDGLPLAIELAAARIRTVQPKAMLDRLESRLKLLTGGPRNLPARQQTLRGAISWSYDLLAPGEQALFRRLATFVGGWQPAAAERVVSAAGETGIDIIDALVSLSDKSLIRQEEHDGEIRLAMLETIREFGLDQLRASREVVVTAEAHAAYYLDLAATAESGPGSSNQGRQLDRLEAEFENFRAALAWFRSRGEVDRGLRLAGALWRFWQVRGFFTEGRAELEPLLDLKAPVDPVIRARALTGAGELARLQADYPTARARIEESLAIIRGLGDRDGLAWALRNLSMIAYYQGNLEEARTRLNESLEIFRELDDQHGLALVLNNLGQIANSAGDYDHARALAEESLRIRRALDDSVGIVGALGNLGDIARNQGDLIAARTLYAESLVRLQELGDRGRIVLILEGLAAVAAADGHPVRALRLAGASAALRQALGASPEAERLAPTLAGARDSLDPAAYARAWDEGEAMSLEQAIAHALETEASADT